MQHTQMDQPQIDMSTPFQRIQAPDLILGAARMRKQLLQYMLENGFRHVWLASIVQDQH
jgi:hypothetical protein